MAIRVAGEAAGESGARSLIEFFNGRLLYSCALIALSQVNFGLELSAFANTIAMAPFQRQFGTLNWVTGNYELATLYLSLLNSLTYIGFAFGVVIGNLVGRLWGRRIAMFIMSGWGILSSVLLITAERRTHMVTARVIGYVYIGMELALVPILQSELVPAQVRGLVVGTFQLGISVRSSSQTNDRSQRLA